MNDTDDPSPDPAEPPQDDLFEVEGSEYEAKLTLCQQRIGYTFRDRKLLHEALTHASGASTRLASNERLEFLGDAILGLVVCEWLYRDYPESSEGELTKIKSSIVSRQSCGNVARQLGLDECLIVGRGVLRNRSFPRSLISDVFESIVAAIYLDSDLATVRDRIHVWMQETLQSATEGRGNNYKSILQQYAQKELAQTPDYRLITEAGPDHSKTFRVLAAIGDRHFTPAWGRNKKEAEQRAAANALAEIEGREIPFHE